MKPKVQSPKSKVADALLAATLFCAFMAAAETQPLSDDVLAQIRFDQRLASQIRLSLPFRDEMGREVRLTEYFGQKPVVLVLGYYQCPMLCTLVLNGMLESAADMKWSIGKEFEVVDVSINPRETSAVAAAKKRAYVKRYGRPGAELGWHFLTGNEAAIRQLTEQVGFHYAYDPVSKEYAHPSGLIVLTPEGKVSAYLFGVTYASKALFESLQHASTSDVASPIQQFILLCFHYNPITGKYSSAIIICLRVLSLTCLAVMIGFFIALSRRGPKLQTPLVTPPPPGPSAVVTLSPP
jgi:protein SCO1/2